MDINLYSCIGRTDLTIGKIREVQSTNNTSFKQDHKIIIFNKNVDYFGNMLGGKYFKSEILFLGLIPYIAILLMKLCQFKCWLFFFWWGGAGLPYC
jgi:hypothetical protein